MSDFEEIDKWRRDNEARMQEEQRQADEALREKRRREATPVIEAGGGSVLVSVRPPFLSVPLVRIGRLPALLTRWVFVTVPLGLLVFLVMGGNSTYTLDGVTHHFSFAQRSIAAVVVFSFASPLLWWPVAKLLAVIRIVLIIAIVGAAVAACIWLFTR